MPFNIKLMDKIITIEPILGHSPFLNKAIYYYKRNKVTIYLL